MELDRVNRVYNQTAKPEDKKGEAVSMASKLTPPEVNMELHVINREKLLKSLRQHLSETSRPLHGFVFLEVCLSICATIKSSTDHIFI